MADTRLSDSVSKTYTTETGEQDMYVVPPYYEVTAAVVAGVGDSVDLEVTLFNGGVRHKVVENISNGTEIKFIGGPIHAIGVDIDANTTGAIVLELKTAKR